MSKICIQCVSKIGLFKTPIEGAYCSERCRDEHRDHLARRRAELERQRSAPPPQPKPQQAARPQAPVMCPKCAGPWHVEAGAGALGASHGACDRCGYESDFVRIDPCPTCRTASMVMQTTEEGRCPRCKRRAGKYQRLTA